MATVSLLGDITIETRLPQQVKESAGFTEAVAAARGADAVIGNLEMPLSRRGYRVPKYSNLRSDPDVIEDVAFLGLDAVSLANNHMMDYGPEAMADTLAACDRAGIAHTGAGPDLDAALEPAWLQADGARVALFSVCCTLPVEADAAPGKPGVAPIRIGFSFEVDTNLLSEQPGTMPDVHSWARPHDQEIVCDRIQSAAKSADMVIVAIHWGVPGYWLSPAQGNLARYQEPLGHALVDAGADVVVGTHSHSLHPIEIYQGKPIFYSLGNFLFEEPRDFMEPESVAARVSVGGSSPIEVVPLMIDGGGFPRRVHGPDADKVLVKLQRLSQPFGTEIEMRNGCGYIRL